MSKADEYEAKAKAHAAEAKRLRRVAKALRVLEEEGGKVEIPRKPRKAPTPSPWPPGEIRRRITAHLAEVGQANTNEIAEAVGRPKRLMSANVSAMRKDGLLRRIRKGGPHIGPSVWALPEEEK